MSKVQSSIIHILYKIKLLNLTLCHIANEGSLFENYRCAFLISFALLFCKSCTFLSSFQIATDPKLALQKAKELWDYLSEDEPENQARPVSLEQLIVLLTRESARRLVHLVNFSAHIASNFPKY